MKNALKITCPNCQKEFDAASVFNAHFEKNKLENEKTDESEIALQQFELIEHSFIGKTIKESKIREITQGLVVGVEHNGRRILNPESNLILSKNDIVWVVGDKKKIKHFFS